MFYEKHFLNSSNLFFNATSIKLEMKLQEVHLGHCKTFTLITANDSELSKLMTYKK